MIRVLLLLLSYRIIGFSVSALDLASTVAVDGTIRLSAGTTYIIASPPLALTSSDGLFRISGPVPTSSSDTDAQLPVLDLSATSRPGYLRYIPWDMVTSVFDIDKGDTTRRSMQLSFIKLRLTLQPALLKSKNPFQARTVRGSVLDKVCSNNACAMLNVSLSRK